jgi:hypothetical protein
MGKRGLSAENMVYKGKESEMIKTNGDWGIHMREVMGWIKRAGERIPSMDPNKNHRASSRSKEQAPPNDDA